MFSLSSLDVAFLVKELRPLLVDAFVDKVYQGKEEKGDFLIRMRSPAQGKQQLYVKVPEAFFLTEHRFVWPDNPPGFCMQLRKHLSNSKVLSIEQHGFERIVEIVFAKGSIQWRLILELFSKGNVVLVNSDGLIRGVLDLQRWKDRTLRVNAPYEYPPEKVNPVELSFEEFSQVPDGREIVKVCATNLSLGGKYAEELLAKTSIDKNATSLSVEQLQELYSAFQELLNQSINPVRVEDDAAPFPLHAWDSAEHSSSFSLAVETLIVGEKTSAIEGLTQDITVSRVSKYQKIIDEQSNKLKGYELASVENQKKGEKLYEHYQEFTQLLTQVQSLHAKGGWGAVKSFLKQSKLPISVDEQKGSIVVDVKEEPL